jgi:hypothetical protein
MGIKNKKIEKQETDGGVGENDLPRDEGSRIFEVDVDKNKGD